MHRLVFFIIIAIGTCFSATAWAQDRAYCAVVGSTSYNAESRLRAARCFKESDVDNTQIYECEDDGSRAALFDGAWYFFRDNMSGPFDPQGLTKDCGLAPGDAYRTWNNPLIRDIHRAGSATVLVLNIALGSLEEPDRGEQIYIVSPLASSLERHLRALPDFPTDGQISFPSSEVRIAGIDIVSAPADHLVSALKARGSTSISLDCTAPEEASVDSCELGTFRMTFPENEGTGSSIDIITALKRIVFVTYRFDAEDGYSSYVRALDDRYGASTRENANGGCTSRNWRSGSIFILGKYCNASDATISFLNVPLKAAFDYYGTYLRSISARPDEQDLPLRPRGDMF